MSLRWLGLALVFVSALASAQQARSQWRVQTSDPWFDSAQSACDAEMAQCSGNANAATCGLGLGGFGSGNNTDTFYNCTVTFGAWPAASFSLTRQRPAQWNPPNATTTVTGNFLTRANPAPGPICPAAGTKRSSIIEGGGTIGTPVCGSDGCAYNIASPQHTVLTGSGFQPVASVQATGASCGSNPSNAGPVESGTNESCTDAGGVIGCIDPENRGCGFFNGDYVCTGHVPNNSCVSFASGGVACMSGAPGAPTAPGGGPAEPAGQVTNGSTTVNYYDNSTVSSSATTVTTTGGVGGSAEGAPGRDGSLGSGGGGEGGNTTIINCDGPDCVELDLEGECPEGETCDGSLPNAGEFGEVCTFGQCASAFYNRVKAAPLLSAVTGAGAAMPSGACPNWTLEAFSEDYSLSAPMCDLWDSVSGVLSAIFLVIWAWVATRIVLSA